MVSQATFRKDMANCDIVDNTSLVGVDIVDYVLGVGYVVTRSDLAQ
jgi:hypothetical protein